MKNFFFITCSLLLLVSCATTTVDTTEKTTSTQPISVKVGMEKPEIVEILGQPQKKKSSTLPNGEIIEEWIYRVLVKEVEDIEQTDVTTEMIPNPLTGEFEEYQVPVKSRVRRSLFQQINVKLRNGEVVGLNTNFDKEMDIL